MNEHLHPIFKRILDGAIKELVDHIEWRESKTRRKLGPNYGPKKALRDLRLIQGGKLPSDELP